MRVTRVMYAAASAALAATLAVPTGADAQGWLKRIKDEAKAKVQQRTDAATDSVTDAAVDKAEHVVKCLVTNLTCMKKAADASQAVQVVNSQGQAVSSADSATAMASAGVAVTQAAATGAPAAAGAAASAAPPGAGAWLNYDFIPGDKILFFDDFAGDNVGDLPAGVDVTNGNATVVDVNGTRYLRTTTGVRTTIHLAQPLPQRFTIEATFHRNGGNGDGLRFVVGAGSNDQSLEMRCDQGGTLGLNGFSMSHDEKSAGETAAGVGPNDFETCRLMVDGGYAKAYVNNQRLAQLNGLDIARGNSVEMDVGSSDANGSLVTDIRIAEGGKPLYDALASTGRVSTHGILFATGSSTLEGESTPTLQEIATMLKAHPELKLTIEGHTDNVGSAAANQTLSEQRAAAVAQYLETNAQIDPSRLVTKGFGDTRPVAPNTTAEGRAQNRRVELVKM